MSAPGTVNQPREHIVSPVELVKLFIDEHADTEILPGKAVVSGADDPQQQRGTVALMDAGQHKLENAAPVIHKRIQCRGMAKNLDHADRIGNFLAELFEYQRWLEIEDTSGIVWLVHEMRCTVLPSHHIDSKETFESLAFIVISVGRDPVSVP